MILWIKNTYLRHPNAIKYAFYSLLISGLHFALFYVAHIFIYSLLTCNIIAYAFTIVASFVINRRIIFKDKQDHRRFQQMGRHVLVKLLSLLIDTVILVILSRWILMPHLWAKLIANCSTTANNYLLSKRFVFENKLKR